MLPYAAIERQLDATIRETHLPIAGARYQGKVRDTYRAGSYLVLVTTDRISAFDHILRQTIPFKGQVLNRLAAFFFERTKDIIANHVIAVPDPNVTLAHACTPIPIEFVVRGYLAGHAWRTYADGLRTLCGEPLPEGLRQNSRLPAPILTPATKADEGHDEDISQHEILERGLLDQATLDTLGQAALALFQRGTELAKKQGLILVDTKYEFGRTPTGDLLLIDEVHTPDSSRYFYADTYDALLAADQPQRQLSKEFVREWLMAQGFQGKEGQRLPDLPDTFRCEIAARYIELYEKVTGLPFEPNTDPDPAGRIERAVAGALLNATD
ncbi:MAG: phosphoribosylaminoimidazolesuccinocarboxamide synthase [Rhodothermales bacterium]|nr:phosphoribosylaminoimidazolesuccinocarboxamide synthase [Rhodothermales bacterium]